MCAGYGMCSAGDKPIPPSVANHKPLTVMSWVEDGEYSYDMENLTEIVAGISYNNAVRYFGFNV